VRSNVRREEVTLEDTLRGLEEGMGLVERAKGVLEEIGRIQAGIFGGGEGAGGIDCKFPPPAGIQSKLKGLENG